MTVRIGDLVRLRNSIHTIWGPVYHPGDLGVVVYIDEDMLYSVIFSGISVCCFRYELELVSSYDLSLIHI